MDNLALVQLMQIIFSGNFGEIPGWLAANWYGIVTTLLTIGYFLKHQAARSLISKTADLAQEWRVSKAASSDKGEEYSQQELARIGQGFVTLADELEERVKKGLFTNRSR